MNIGYLITYIHVATNPYMTPRSEAHALLISIKYCRHRMPVKVKCPVTSMLCFSPTFVTKYPKALDATKLSTSSCLCNLLRDSSDLSN